MAIIRWRGDNDLFSQLDRMQRDMSSWMTAARPLLGGDLATFRPEVYPPLNIYDDGETFIVRAEIPGVDPKSVDVGPNASYHRRERDSGQFRRAFTLPKPIDNNKVMASCTNGVLEIRLPYAEEAKRRKITVK